MSFLVQSFVSFLAQSMFLQFLFVIVITPSVNMFIGQGQSLDACRATQVERAANVVVVATPAAEYPSSAPPPPPALLARHPVSLFGTATGAASLSIAAPSATVAAATTAAPCLPAVRCAAQPDDPVPRKSPGKKEIMRPNMIPFVLVIFSLMDTIGPHVKVGNRNSRATAKWKELFEHFFHRTDGVGWQFELWEGVCVCVFLSSGYEGGYC
jgi:hypothetical protein